MIFSWGDGAHRGRVIIYCATALVVVWTITSSIICRRIISSMLKIRTPLDYSPRHGEPLGKEEVNYISLVASEERRKIVDEEITFQRVVCDVVTFASHLLPQMTRKMMQYHLGVGEVLYVRRECGEESFAHDMRITGWPSLLCKNDKEVGRGDSGETPPILKSHSRRV